MSTANQKRFHEFLGTAELEKRTFSVEEAASATGLSEASVKTYLSKKLKGSWAEPVTGVGGIRYEVKGIASMSWPEFQRLMTQKAQAASKDPTAWKLELRKLILEGVGAGLPVADIVREVLGDLRVR
jgi:hypothetical protein